MVGVSPDPFGLMILKNKAGPERWLGGQSAACSSRSEVGSQHLCGAWLQPPAIPVPGDTVASSVPPQELTDRCIHKKTFSKWNFENTSSVINWLKIKP